MAMLCTTDCDFIKKKYTLEKELTHFIQKNVTKMQSCFGIKINYKYLKKK